MNCLEAQSKIMAYIDGKLPDDEQREFIKHVRSCASCYEELDIYYTLIVGMKELDESDNISDDFKDSLSRRLDDDMSRMTTVKRIASSTIMVVIAAVTAGLIWLYSSALDKVYRYEQNSKLSAQPADYYASFFDDRLFDDEKYVISPIDKYYSSEEETDSTLEFMSNVRKYNENHGSFSE